MADVARHDVGIRLCKKKIVRRKKIDDRGRVVESAVRCGRNQLVGKSDFFPFVELPVYNILGPSRELSASFWHTTIRVRCLFPAFADQTATFKSSSRTSFETFSGV